MEDRWFGLGDRGRYPSLDETHRHNYKFRHLEIRPVVLVGRCDFARSRGLR